MSYPILIDRNLPFAIFVTYNPNIKIYFNIKLYISNEEAPEDKLDDIESNEADEEEEIEEPKDIKSGQSESLSDSGDIFCNLKEPTAQYLPKRIMIINSFD